MLKNLKNKWRELKAKQANLNVNTIFIIVATVIGLLFGGWGVFASEEPLLKEENYLAMEELITTIVESKNSDIKLDNTKISQYTAVHKENGEQKISISGNNLERIEATISKEYELKSLVRYGELIFFLFCLVYICCIVVIIEITNQLLIWIYNLIKKILRFFKK